MSKISAILYDMDGVLSDTQTLHVAAEVETCAHFGISVSAQNMEGEAGKPDAMSFIDLYGRHDKDSALAKTMMQHKYDTVIPRLLRETGM